MKKKFSKKINEKMQAASQIVSISEIPQSINEDSLKTEIHQETITNKNANDQIINQSKYN